MTPASMVLAAALAAWGAVAPVPEPAQPDAARRPAPAVPAGAPVEPLVAPAATATAAAPVVQAPIVAKTPVVVRTKPVLVDAEAPDRRRPPRPPRPPLYKQWAFWAIAGGLFATSVIVTIAVTRPPPQPYTGNAPPYIVGFP